MSSVTCSYQVLEVLLPYLELRDIPKIEALGQRAQGFLNERFVLSELRVLRDDISLANIEDCQWWGPFIDRCAPVLKRLVLDSKATCHCWDSGSLLHNVLLSLIEKGMPRLEQCVLAVDFTSNCLGTAANPIELPQLRYLNLIGSRFKFLRSEYGFIYINAPCLEFLAISDRAKPYVQVSSESPPCLIGSITRDEWTFGDRYWPWDIRPEYLLWYDLPDHGKKGAPSITKWESSVLPREEGVEDRNTSATEKEKALRELKRCRQSILNLYPRLVWLAWLDSGVELELRIPDWPFYVPIKAWHNLVRAGDLSRIPPWLVAVPYLEARDFHSASLLNLSDLDIPRKNIFGVDKDWMEYCEKVFASPECFPPESTEIIYSAGSTQFTSSRLPCLKHLKNLRKVEFHADLWNLYSRCNRECLPTSSGWPKDCAVLLLGRSNVLPTNFAEYESFKATIDGCKINLISVSGYPSDIESLFWTYIAISQAAHNVRAVFQRLSVIPHRWRAAVYEMASGEYTVAVMNGLLSSVSLSSDQLQILLRGDGNLQFNFPLETWHSVGVLRHSLRDEFANFYKAMLKVIPFEAFPFLPFDEMSCIGRLRPGCRWLSDRVLAGRFEELVDWGIPPMFPLASSSDFSEIASAPF